MKDMLEKGIRTTLGFWLLVHEEADKVIRDMVEKGKLAPEEGRHFLDELSKQVDEEKEALKEKFSSTAESTLSSAGLATKKDLAKLNSTLKKIEARLDTLEGKKKPAKKK